MMEPVVPRFQWRQRVQALLDLYNDGSFPECPVEALLGFHEKAGVCQAPEAWPFNSRLQHLATPFALLPSALLTSPVWGSVPIEVPRKGGCCNLAMTISNGSSTSPQSPERGDSLKGRCYDRSRSPVGKLLKFV